MVAFSRYEAVGFGGPCVAQRTSAKSARPGPRQRGGADVAGKEVHLIEPSALGENHRQRKYFFAGSAGGRPDPRAFAPASRLGQ